MATRHVFLFALGLAFGSTALAPFTARAAEDDVAVPEVENAKYQFIGKITGTTFVRSGPSNNFYATSKLDKGTEVHVVGIKYDWLKIVPPEGSFSLVPQVYIHLRGDGKVGRVTNALNVRAGSSENAMKSTIQTKLMPGQDVRVLGSQDEYLKIVPPEGAYVFVHQQFVEMVRRHKAPVGEIVKDQRQAPGESAEDSQLARASEEPSSEAPGSDDSTDDRADVDPDMAELEQADAGTGSPDTRPADAVANVGAAAAAKPVPDAVAQDFRKLEAEFEAANGRSVIDQPIDELTEGYTRLVEGGALRGSMKRIADARLQALQMRADAREQLREFRKAREEMDRKQNEFAVERQEIDERIAQTKISTFTAVGTLRISSLQQGDTLMYRLTDPSTSRTIAYVRSNDPKYAALMNQFVGVRGELTNDRQRLKIISATDAEAVDPSKVNSTVVATIVPPSMVATAALDQGDAAN